MPFSKARSSQTRVLAGFAEVGLGMYNNITANDVVTAISMPVFMLQSAVSSMANVKQIGSQVREAEKKELILTILGALLMVIPFVGEGARALFGGAEMIVRIAALISEAGNVALGVEQIVSELESAPWVILTLLGGEIGGVVGKSGEEDFSVAAQARKGMRSSDLAHFPDDFHGRQVL
ncbi:hypothetical protein C8A03DRAFT_19370 [Achaetomium macrosporum]|uniref:Uncharacterized protein n=1 Tax=Achaetomium macrosporum TaxID=79813 RepID=A0AAN7H758_9PEZI|nr:hypothetical protein C8A03DRAFT_19370 [Achaetomium macrosporum]